MCFLRKLTSLLEEHTVFILLLILDYASYKNPQILAKDLSFADAAAAPSLRLEDNSTLHSTLTDLRPAPSYGAWHTKFFDIIVSDTHFKAKVSSSLANVFCHHLSSLSPCTEARLQTFLYFFSPPPKEKILR